MGSHGNDDGKTTSMERTPVENFGCFDTEPFESQLSPSLSPSGKYDVGGDSKWQYLQSTLSFNDTTPVEDALETELVTLAGETQPLNDVDGIEDMETQLLDVIGEGAFDSDGEGTDITQVLENVDELSADDAQYRGSGQSADSKDTPCKPYCGHGEKKLLVQTDATFGEQTSSGSMPPRFTFLPAESLWEAALNARNMALKQTKGETDSVTDTNQSREPLAVKDNGEPGGFEKFGGVDQEYGHGEVEGFMNKNKSKVASSAVRKLFNDELPAEKKGPSLSSNGVNGGEGLAKLPVYDGELAGLSYVDSQEPGELSQANALDFIDRFLEDTIIEFDQEANHVKNVQEKSKSLPSTKGQQSLAKRANDRGKAGKTGIFDWDDSHEDEGGGDIFLRRKEEFFEGESCRQKSLSGVSKIKVSRPNDGEEQLEPDALESDAQEMLGVGLDTQMAAEAMESLCHGESIVNHDANGAAHVTRSSLTDSPNRSSAGKTRAIMAKKHSRQYDRKRKFNVELGSKTSSLSKRYTKEAKQQCKKDNLMKTSKRSKLNAEDNLISIASENGRELPSQIFEQRKSSGDSKSHQVERLNKRTGIVRGTKRHLQGGLCHFTPIAYRTRQSLVIDQLVKPDRPSINFRQENRGVDSSQKRNSCTSIQAAKALDPNSTIGCSNHFGVDENTKSSQLEKSASKFSTFNNGTIIDKLEYPRRRRSLRKLSCHDEGSEKLRGSSKPSAQSEKIGKSNALKRKMRTAVRSVVKSNVNGQAQSYPYSVSIISSNHEQGKMSDPILDKANLGDTPICCNVVDKDANLNSNGKNGTNFSLSAKSFEDTELVESSRERWKSFDLASSTPAKFKTTVNDASPVFTGDDYNKQTRNTNASISCLVKAYPGEFLRELRRLSATGPETTTPSKDSRKRRDMTDVLVLFSQHLDEDIIKHQKKILARVGASVASSISDATHFVADEFVRTRNMLEAIASGKPVVTHLWIVSCGQACCFIDEKNYILRDAKKEKEFGFSMPVSLARASQRPLLKGRRVLITPNTKPCKEIISSLVKAVQGQAVERIGRSALKDDKIPDDLLVLSCEEDYASCVSFLEKGAAIYSSELLLNGIVTQKLEYERHRLFADHVKKTRSTIWLKRDARTFLRVTKCK